MLDEALGTTTRVKLLRLLALSSGREFSEKQLAEAGMSLSEVNRQMRELVETGVVTVTDGLERKYRFNRQCIFAKPLLELFKTEAESQVLVVPNEAVNGNLSSLYEWVRIFSNSSVGKLLGVQPRFVLLEFQGKGVKWAFQKSEWASLEQRAFELLQDKVFFNHACQSVDKNIEEMYSFGDLLAKTNFSNSTTQELEQTYMKYGRLVEEQALYGLVFITPELMQELVTKKCMR